MGKDTEVVVRMPDGSEVVVDKKRADVIRFLEGMIMMIGYGELDSIYVGFTHRGSFTPSGLLHFLDATKLSHLGEMLKKAAGQCGRIGTTWEGNMPPANRSSAIN